MMAFTLVEFEAYEAAGRCECGTPLDEHPPLAAPLRWEHGRPCGKSALQRGYGWDGRPAPEHTDGNKARWGVGIQVTRPAAPQPEPEPVPPPRKSYRKVPQEVVLAALARNNGNSLETAREVDLTVARVNQIRRAVFGPGLRGRPGKAR